MLAATDIASEAIANSAVRPGKPVSGPAREAAPPSRADAAPAAKAAAPAAEAAPAAAEAAPADNARLSYDREKKRVYVEILDPRTGEVIQRLPPESAVSRMIEISGGRLGALVDSTA